MKLLPIALIAAAGLTLVGGYLTVPTAVAGAPASKAAKVDSQPAVKMDEEAIKTQLKAKFPDFVVSLIRPSSLPGIYEVAMGDELVYVSNDGKHLIFGGTLLDIQDKPVNLTQKSLQELDSLKSPMRADAIAKSDVARTITFKAADEKYSISVFTDIDCGYCQKLHSQIAQVNALGITVHYYGFPRAGLGSESHRKLVNVWCADNPQSAMTAAKSGQSVASKTCNNPLEEHFNLVRSLGLGGTPAIILKDGTLLPGYMPPDRLLEQVKMHLG